MTPTLHYLLDGAMVGGADSRLPAALPHPAWLYPLAGRDDPGAPFGAILLDPQAAAAAQQQETLLALRQAVPSGLHWSVIESALTPAQMAAHLSQFTKILLDDRQTYFLRFTDCRVLLVLSSVLTAGQWRALTAPMATWEIHLRDGSRHALPLGGSDVEPAAAPWILRDNQVAACMDAEEADILLNQLGYTLDNMGENIHHYWNAARRCVAAWQQDGAGNRQTLFYIARRAFQPEGTGLQASELNALFLASPPVC
ncbi:DUF4123 domain-containing protein [Janthinobacterium sp. CG3]|uniref:DUF4123 domain-containing protein n=1 Tax=Janthinobacterium sp. CG3 TaxID=1075768 RepID=UPI0009DAA397|nr:DUF4123 domain-containing protein [Janthinobacterium sp. CG3]